MADRTSTATDWIFSSRQFDPAWYRDAFPDVAALEMDPALHYRRYGSRMGRAPNAALAADPEQLQALMLPPPAKGRELLRAHEIALSGAHDRAIHYARRHLPPDLAHTLSVLQANRALAQGDMEGWLAHVNGYLCHFGVDPLVLTPGNSSIFKSISTNGHGKIDGGPLVSIIMPAWNAEDTVETAARSILNQTWQNIELIIIDDASEDNTWRTIRDLSESDGRVRIRRNDVNVGPYVSKNFGLEMANGEWITGHDADDWAHPRRIERHLALALEQSGHIQASLTFMIRMTDRGIFDTISSISPFSPDGVRRISSISALFSRDFIKERLGYWDSVRFGADSEMIARARKILGDGFLEFDDIGMMCLSLESSLTNHPEHGIKANSGGLSKIRTEYKKSWTEAHRTTPNDKLYLPFPQKERVYMGDFDHVVPPTDIMANINQTSFQKSSEERNQG